MVPEIPTEAAQKIKEREDIRAINPTSDRLATLKEEINKLINIQKRDKWREKVQDINFKQYQTKLFKLIKHLNGGAKASKNESIKFKGKYLE